MDYVEIAKTDEISAGNMMSCVSRSKKATLSEQIGRPFGVK